MAAATALENGGDIVGRMSEGFWLPAYERNGDDIVRDDDLRPLFVLALDITSYQLHQFLGALLINGPNAIGAGKITEV